MNVTVKLTGPILEGRARTKLLTIVERWVRGELQFVQADMERRAPVDTGNYKASFVNRVKRSGMVVTGTVDNQSNPPVLQKVIEFGRRPGAKMPPQGVLLPWMARHGIPASAEFLVRRKIGRDGLPAQLIFQKALAREATRFRGQTVRLKQQLIAGLK